MVYNFKKFKYKYVLIFTIAFSSLSAFELESFEKREPATMKGDKCFIYPSKVIEYTASGLTIIEVNLCSKGEVEKPQII